MDGETATPQTPQGAAIPADPAAGAIPSMLLGTYAPKVDAKGRVALPAKFRTQLGSGCVLARGQERCLYLFPMAQFQRVAAKVQQVSLSNKQARQYLRVFLSGAVDEVPDKQGRVVIPQMLRDYAGLTDDIVIIGVGTRAEVWDKDAWNEYLNQQEDEYSDMADDIFAAGGF